MKRMVCLCLLWMGLMVGCLGGGKDTSECKTHADCPAKRFCFDTAPHDAFLPNWKCLEIKSKSCSKDADCGDCPKNGDKTFTCQKEQCMYKGDKSIAFQASDAEPPEICPAS